MISFVPCKLRSIGKWIPVAAILLPAFFAAPAFAQPSDSITLEKCYQLAEANYPLSKQRDLIEHARQFTISNIAKGVYPQLTINGAATYQSDVTKIALPPIAGYDIHIPTVSQDQYKLYGEVSQTITDFGINKQRRAISSTESGVQQENLNTQLYTLKDRINQLFFGIVLIDGQLQQNELSKQDIRTGIRNVQARIDNGTDFNSNLNKLEAQLLQAEEQSVSLRSSRQAYVDMLGLFINQPISDNTVLVKPASPALIDSITRPELNVYDLQQKSYLQQQQLTKMELYPKLDAFFQGGVGRPSPVNFLSTNFSTYYITGIRLNWNFGSLYTYRKDRLLSQANQDMITVQRNTFLFNTRLTMKQQHADIAKYQQLIAADDRIIELRQSVKKASAVQLANGVITANDYLSDINAEAQSRQDRLLHEIQLLLTQYDYKTTTGH